MNEFKGLPDENHVVAERRAKLKAWRETGNAYPNDFTRRHLAFALHEKYGNLEHDGFDGLPPVAVAGRLILKRIMGKASFATLRDMSGDIQLYLNDSDTGKALHEAFKHNDIGDILGATGTLFKTKKGELSIRVQQLRLLAKSLRPLPEKFHGLADQEQRYRQRYLDLIANDASRRIFILRSHIIQSIRNFLLQEGYLEVETPMMHPIPGGAAARPFSTHHNALDIPLYLRIAPELYLKRLVAGGFEKVFELNRSFRNEGISTRHNPEFTMLEFYAAYANYETLMTFIEGLLRHAAWTVLGTTKILYQGREFDLNRPFSRLRITEALKKFHPDFTAETLNQRETLIGKLNTCRASFRPEDSVAALQLALFENTVESQLVEPTYIYHYPAEVSPLARRNDREPEFTDRFELYIAGREIANGFSELNDPEDQAMRFIEQTKQKEAGNPEAMHYDADYIRALEYGLPPTAGAGIGIDRLVMLLTDCASIRDVILFPLLRPESN